MVRQGSPDGRKAGKSERSEPPTYHSIRAFAFKSLDEPFQFTFRKDGPAANSYGPGFSPPP